MSVRPIVLLGDPRLRLKGLPVDSFGKYLHELLDDLAHTMRDAPGVGLAAPQLGEALQACVIEVENQLYELVNPRIVRSSGDDRDLEGCLSIPGYVAYVTRREKVWVVAQDRHGKKIKVAGSGLLGRALQHELDHLDGKLYIDYLESMDELMAVGAGRRGRRGDPRGDERPGVTDASRSARSSSEAAGSAVPSLRRLAGHAEPSSLVGVVTAPPRPAGRTQAPTADGRSHDARRELGIPPILTPGAAARAGGGRRRSWRCDPGSSSSPTTGRSCRRALLELAARRAQPPPVAAAAAPRRDADPGGDPGRRPRDRRHADADGRGPRHRADRRAGRACALDGTETAPDARGDASP